MRILKLAVLLALAAAGAASSQTRYAGIQVVDEATGRGVPLVELTTVDGVARVTDSAGVVAVDEPAMVGMEVFFEVKSHGYEAPKDGFGIRGVRVKLQSGQVTQIKIKRLNIAERLYRTTGAGIYRDSVLLDRPTPIKQPLLNGQVAGCDSVQTALYRGKMFWLWGDTSRPGYPLGNFDMTGASTPRPAELNLDKGIDFTYHVDKTGFARGMAPISGEGPTWLDGLVVVDEDGNERLYAAYVKIKNLLETYERGLCRFNDETGVFERVERFPLDAPAIPHGHPIKRREDGAEWVYFGDPFPLVRAPAKASALRDLSAYQAYTCLKPGTKVDEGQVVRGPDGKAEYAWRRNAPPVNPEDQEKLIRAGKLKREEALIQLRDLEGGKFVTAHRGTVRWNKYRKRWILIATEIGGSSMLGEVWYAEAPEPLGPWRDARRILTHERYSFYNPVHHPEFDAEGRRIYFEGTYTNSFSGNPHRTPRYDYNQMMYRLDLADPRLQSAK